MEGLNFDNILPEDEVENLFSEVPVTQTNDSSEANKVEEDQTKNTETTEVDPENLFEDSPESVGSVETKEKEDTDSSNNGISPDNFYSSIAKALKNDGILQDLDDETVSKITDPEGFAAAIEQQIKAGFDAKQKRIDDALNVGVEPSAIKSYENTLDYLDDITDEAIAEESDAGENLRKQLIYQDFLNRGYSKEQATKKLQKSLDSGSDVEDAKEALEGNKEFFTKQYNDLVDEAKKEAENQEANRKKQAETLKKSILDDSKIFGELEVDRATRQKIYENISKPIYQDPKTGELLTAVQKYQKENVTDFLKNIGLCYTLTDGFKSMENLVKSKVRNEVRKNIKELENTINNTARNSDGSLKFVSGVSSTSASTFGKQWDLDI